VRRWHVIGIILSVLIAAPTTAEEPDSSKAAENEWPTVNSVTVRVRHRVWEKFKEEAEVEIGEEFQIGDTEYTARIVRFVPDFAMKMQSKEVISRTPEPNNPAVRIIVLENEEPTDTTWAFTQELPHYGRLSLLAFQIIRIDFEDREPIVVPDTLETEDSK
jgi:hypothetical protein